MVLMLIAAAVQLLCIAVAIVAFAVVVHSFHKLISTAYAPETDRRAKILFQVIPFLLFTRTGQPESKWKYTDRFAIGTLVFLAALGLGLVMKVIFEQPT